MKEVTVDEAGMNTFERVVAALVNAGHANVARRAERTPSYARIAASAIGLRMVEPGFDPAFMEYRGASEASPLSLFSRSVGPVVPDRGFAARPSPPEPQREIPQDWRRLVQAAGILGAPKTYEAAYWRRQAVANELIRLAAKAIAEGADPSDTVAKATRAVGGEWPYSPSTADHVEAWHDGGDDSLVAEFVRVLGVAGGTSARNRALSLLGDQVGQRDWIDTSDKEDRHVVVVDDLDADDVVGLMRWQMRADRRPGTKVVSVNDPYRYVSTVADDYLVGAMGLLKIEVDPHHVVLRARDGHEVANADVGLTKGERDAFRKFIAEADAADVVDDVWWADTVTGLINTMRPDGSSIAWELVDQAVDYAVNDNNNDTLRAASGVWDVWVIPEDMQGSVTLAARLFWNQTREAGAQQIAVRRSGPPAKVGVKINELAAKLFDAA